MRLAFAGLYRTPFIYITFEFTRQIHITLKTAVAVVGCIVNKTNEVR